MHENEKGSVPVPDPTKLTTEALLLAVDNLKELLVEKIGSSHNFLMSRIDSTNQLKEEKFKETWERLDLMEKQRHESKSDNEKAIANALAAQERLFAQKNQCNEDAQNKAEASFTKLIDALKSEIAVTTKAINDKIDTQGLRDKSQSNWMIGLIVIGGVSVCALIVNVIALFMHAPK